MRISRKIFKSDFLNLINEGAETFFECSNQISINYVNLSNLNKNKYDNFPCFAPKKTTIFKNNLEVYYTCSGKIMRSSVYCLKAQGLANNVCSVCANCEKSRKKLV